MIALALAAALQSGSKQFTESVILAEIAVQTLRAAGVEAEHRREVGGTRVLWEALRARQIDLYPEYTGTIVEELLGGERDFAAALPRLALRAGGSLGFEDTYAIGMRRAESERQGIRSLSDLARHRELFDPRGDSGRIPAQPARHQRDVLVGQEVREQGAPLDHVSYLAPDRLQPVRRQGLPAEAHRAAVGSDQPVQHPQQRGFPRAARSDQRRRRRLGNRQIDRSDDHRPAVALHDRRGFEDRHPGSNVARARRPGEPRLGGTSPHALDGRTFAAEDWKWKASSMRWARRSGARWCAC